MTAALRLELGDVDLITLDAPAGLLSPADVAMLADVVDAVRPTLARLSSPQLPPRSTWPATWCEVFEERLAIAAEGGAVDPEEVADADLRVMLSRGDVPSEVSL